MTFLPEYTAALVIGFLGSLHCLGMCGPIALVVPSVGQGLGGRFTGGIIYNSGRIITYAALGLIAGFLGKGFALFEWQQVISIALGSLIILYNVAPALFRKLGMNGELFFTPVVKSSLSKLMAKKSPGTVLAIGLLNGLLPCGLVYLGLAGSIDMASTGKGALFMAFFGLGTIPMMSGIHLAGYNLKGTLKNRLSRIIPILAITIGALFILRGLGLGIPYVSPSMDPHSGDIHCTSPAHRHT